MIDYGVWSPYGGREALLLAAVLFAVGAGLAYLGMRQRGSVGFQTSGVAISILLVVVWLLSVATQRFAAGTYLAGARRLEESLSLPEDPMRSITIWSAFVAFAVISWLSLNRGLKVALLNASVGAIVGFVFFELPFDLIVMGKTHPPQDLQLFNAVYFLPLLLFDICSLGLLTISRQTRVSRYTLFSLAALFLVFGVWALFGFAFPSEPKLIALGAAAKIVGFAAAVTLFIPDGQRGSAGASAVRKSVKARK